MWKKIVIVVLTCLIPPSVHALDPTRHVTQYVHTAWRVQDGFAPVTQITQTADGYLWFAASTGLLRFDGVKFTTYDLPPLSPVIRGYNDLLGARDGSLWIGTFDGIVRLKDGKLQWYSDPAQHSGVMAILEDPEGTIWFTRYRVPHGEGPLCRVEGNDVHCYGKADGIPVRYGLGLARDSEGNLWFGSSVLCRWRPGSASTYLNDIKKRPDTSEGIFHVAAGPDGTIWAATDNVTPGTGVLSSSGGKWATYVVPGFDGSKAHVYALFMDRENTLWIGTGNDGAYRVHDGMAEHFGISEGLSGKDVDLIYEDREGNIWMLTDGGIDMFRDTAVVDYSQREGLSEAGIRSILALQDGSLWIGNANVIDILNKDGRHSVLPAKGRFDKPVTSLFQDPKGTVWVARGTDLFAYDHGRFIPYKRPDGSGLGKRDIAAITQDTIGNIWVLTIGHLLFHIEGDIAVQVLTVSDDNRVSGSIAPDHKGGLWISSGNDVLTYYKDGNVRKVSMNKPDGSFSIFEVSVDSDDALLVATTQGLFHWDAQHWQKLDASSGLPDNVVLSVLRDKDNAVWVRCQKGLVRISEPEFDKWRQQNDYKPAMEVFDRLDGARPERALLPTQPSVTKTPDGRLWFVANTVVQMIDPRRTFRNPIPPPMHIENLIADHKAYRVSEKIYLPALSRDIEIDYTALSFVTPQHVRFRYKLEGHDQDWQEAGTRRQVFYSNLSPGSYRFRVIASNNSGVWNEVGATLPFSVAPAYYQTAWFRVAVVLAIIMILWTLYRLRMQQMAKYMNARFDERIAERNRLAGEFHDTILQTVQATKLMAEHVRAKRSTDQVQLREGIDRISECLTLATTEARAALNALRNSTTQRNDLAAALESAAQKAQAGSSMKPVLSVEGAHELHPIVRDEIYRIGCEAIRNATQHSGADELRIMLAYGQDFVLRISDKGKGIEPDILNNGRTGHYGLPGMRERASRIHGTFRLRSELGTGTEVELRVPGQVAYQASNSTLEKLTAALRRLFGKA